MKVTDRALVPVAEITAGLAERFGSEYQWPVTNRWVGGVLRRRLNLRTYKSHGVYVVPMSERSKVEALCARYGVNHSSSEGDMGTMGTA